MMESAPKLYDFYNMICKKDSLLKFMRDKHLIRENMTCWKCSSDMTLSAKECKSDGQEWKCRTCLSTNSIRKNTIFEVSMMFTFVNFTICIIKLLVSLSYIEFRYTHTCIY